jgi:hypothetical protein
MKFIHLEDVKQTYFEHFKDALYYSFASLRASIYFLIHGIYPDIFITSGSSTIFNINGQIINKYKNK